jgi:hypothetical protein
MYSVRPRGSRIIAAWSLPCRPSPVRDRRPASSSSSSWQQSSTSFEGFSDSMVLRFLLYLRWRRCGMRRLPLRTPFVAGKCLMNCSTERWKASLSIASATRPDLCISVGGYYISLIYRWWGATTAPDIAHQCIVLLVVLFPPKGSRNPDASSVAVVGSLSRRKHLMIFISLLVPTDAQFLLNL